MQPQTLFTNYIIAGITAMLARVQAAAYVVPEADRQQAWHLLSFGLKLDDAWPVTRDLLLALAPKMELAGFREEWIPYLEKGLQCAQRINDEITIAECKLQIGMLNRLLGRFNEACLLIIESINHFFVQGNDYGQARSLNELAWLEQLRHDYQDATKHVTYAMEKISDNEIEMAVSYRVKGMIALGQRQWQDAENMHRKALELFHLYDDKRRSAWSLVNIGVSLVEQTKLDEAVSYYQQASLILGEINDTYNLAMVQMNLGVAYYRLGQPADSLTYCTKSKILFDKINDTLSRARITTNLGLCNLGLHDYEIAEQNFLHAIDLYSQINDQAWMVNAMDGLGMTYMSMKQYEKAAQIFNRALADLQEIKENPYFEVFHDSLTTHLQEAYQHTKVNFNSTMNSNLRSSN